MKFVDLFCGIGGFRLGMESAGHECIWANDNDEFCARIYEKNFGEKSDTKNIRAIRVDEVPDHDIICAGFPFQAFSVAGKRKGFADDRGNLFFEIIRIAKAKKSSYLFFENVKGLLTHDKGNTLAKIITTLSELGYDLQWQVLNSKNFGVPQSRERLFIIGHFRKKPRPQIFPIKKNEKRIQAQKIKKIGQISNHQWGRVFSPNGLAPTLTTQYGGTLIGFFNKEKFEIRKLTPLEYERLQGFPDNWTKGVSDTQRYKMLGNAVTLPVIETIAKKIKLYEENTLHRRFFSSPS